jgi:hypothetical protein
MTVSMKMTGLVLTGSYVRTTDIDPNSHLDRNELEPTSGSVPKADLVQKQRHLMYQKVPSYFVKSCFYF